LAFVAARFSSLPIILAVCALTGLVGINYAVICRYFTDGGGVYSAAKSQGRLLAVVGALLLVADLTVTAALSGWSALTYVISGAEHIVWLKFLKDHTLRSRPSACCFFWDSSTGLVRSTRALSRSCWRCPPSSSSLFWLAFPRLI